MMWRTTTIIVSGAGAELCERYPYLYPKKAYVGVATLTRVLDDVKLIRRVPTSSETVYLLEFKRHDGKYVYALWTSTGYAKMRMKFGKGKVENISFYGAERKFTGKEEASEYAHILFRTLRLPPFRREPQI